MLGSQRHIAVYVMISSIDVSRSSWPLLLHEYIEIIDYAVIGLHHCVPLI